MLRATIMMSAALLAGTAWAGRTLELLEDAIETRLADLTLPNGAAGTAIVMPCDGCEPRSFRATNETRYFIRDRRVTHAEVVDTVAAIRSMEFGNEGTLVGVFYDRQSKLLTRIVIIPLQRGD